MNKGNINPARKVYFYWEQSFFPISCISSVPTFDTGSPSAAHIFVNTREARNKFKSDSQLICIDSRPVDATDKSHLFESASAASQHLRLGDWLCVCASTAVDRLSVLNWLWLTRAHRPSSSSSSSSSSASRSYPNLMNCENRDQSSAATYLHPGIYARVSQKISVAEKPRYSTLEWKICLFTANTQFMYGDFFNSSQVV